MMKNKNLLIIAIFAFICTFSVAYAWANSLQLLLHHWELMGTPCVKCAESFSRHIYSPNHIGPLILFIISSFGILRGFFFLKNENLLHMHLSGKTYKKVKIVKNTSAAAWVSGIINPQIHVNAKFWQSLSASEKKALKAHEICHIEQKHTLQLVLLGWSKALLPIPFVSYWLNSLILNTRIRSELEADSNALRITSRKTLASVLYKALQFEELPLHYSSIGVGSSLFTRVNNLTSNQHHPHKKYSFHITTPIIFCVGIAVFYTFFHSFLIPLQNCA